MGKVTLVTGGSRSGKSKFAEELLKEQEDVIYIATAIVTDSEMESRITRHRERRNNNWITYEGYKDLDKILDEYENKYIMLDCITVMITNLIFEEERDFDNITDDEVDKLTKNIESQFEKFILKAKKQDKNLVMVTNEVGCGIVPQFKLSRIFRDIAGSMNQFIAKLSDDVYLVSCGLPLKLK